ncbi:hypothetical protein ABPG75_011245 [Micractinium tetrahymenae]
MRAAVLAAPQAAAAQLRQQTATSARPAVAFVAARPQQRQRRALSSRSGRDARLLCLTAAQAAEGGKLISKVEIPAFIPRPDLIDQLVRWAMIEVQENGVANCGMPCKVTAFKREDQLWGFTVSFLKDGESAADVRVAFDEEVTLKHDWVGRGADGFPVLEGNAEEIMGKNFEIRKVCNRQINDATRSAIRSFCQQLVSSVNKYYAFGSCFVDDAT